MVRCLMRLSGIHWRLVRVAAMWLLSASLVHSLDHLNRVSQPTKATNLTVAAEASVSEDVVNGIHAKVLKQGACRETEGAREQVVSPSRHKREPHQVEIDIADQLPEEAQDAPLNQTLPSPRCAHREEWQGACRLWSGKTHNRYLLFNHLRAKEGMGANLMRVAWALNRAISFDLEPVFVGPLLAGHGTGDFGDWMGLTHNPLLVIQDPGAFERATNQSVPFPEGDHDAWFREQENRTYVVYKADAMSVHKIIDWGKPVSKPNSDARVCPYVRQALRNIYWSVPQKRGRCHAFIAEGHHVPPEAVVSEAAGYQPERKRPWVLAVHVRRGDMIHFHHGARSIPHRYFSAAVNSVLRGIAVIDPSAHVSVLVFSEGPKTLKELQLPDENGNAVTWDIEHESCLDIGLNCSQKILLHTSVFEAFDCLATADVVVGSESSFSEAAAAVSTNVKVMVWENQTEQDRVTLNSSAAASSGDVSSDEQLEMETAIADWWHCSGEVQRSTESNARLFYQTVDEGFPSR